MTAILGDDGYWRDMAYDAEGRPLGAVIVNSPVLLEGEVEIDLTDLDIPGRRTSVVDLLALLDLQGRCLGGGVGSTGAVTEGPNTGTRGERR